MGTIGLGIDGFDSRGLASLEADASRMQARIGAAAAQGAADLGRIGAAFAGGGVESLTSRITLMAGALAGLHGLGQLGSMADAWATIVDAATISAPSSTKSEDKARDPEMHQTHKGKPAPALRLTPAPDASTQATALQFAFDTGTAMGRQQGSVNGFFNKK